MVRVSVIIAAYNAEAFITRAIESVLGQIGTTIELLVVDDCSTDETRQLVRGYGLQDSRVKLIECSQNGGPGFARNLGLAYAQGEWIAILDADDAFLPDRLKRLIELANHYGADVVTDNLLMRYSMDGEATETMFPSNRWAEPTWLRVDEFIDGNFGRRDRQRQALGIMKPLIRRGFVEKHGISYEISRFAEDYILDLRLFIGGAKWLIAPFAAYPEYTVRSNSITMKSSRRDIEAFIGAERDIASHPYFKSNPVVSEKLQHHLDTLEAGHAWARFCRCAESAGTHQKLCDFI